MKRFVVGYLTVLEQALDLAAKGCGLAISVLDPTWNTEWFPPMEPSPEDGPDWAWNDVF